MEPPISYTPSTASPSRTLVFFDMETTGQNFGISLPEFPRFTANIDYRCTAGSPFRGRTLRTRPVKARPSEATKAERYPQKCDIIQLAAISGGYNFNVYVIPGVQIDNYTELYTGFKVRNGELLQKDKAIPTVTLYEALTGFISFLRSFGQPVLLGAHNAKCFHKPVLERALFRCSLTQQFQQLSGSFLDTLLLSKALCPGLDSYKQGDLSYPFLGKLDDSHNAFITVSALQQLVSRWTPDQESVAQSLF